MPSSVALHALLIRFGLSSPHRSREQGLLLPSLASHALRSGLHAAVGTTLCNRKRNYTPIQGYSHVQPGGALLAYSTLALLDMQLSSVGRAIKLIAHSIVTC